MSKSTSRRPKFRQCAKFEHALFDVAQNLTKAELRRALREANAATDANCSFIVFELRGLITTLVHLELRRRDKRRRQQVLPLL